MKLSKIAKNIGELQKEFRERIIPYWVVFTESDKGRFVSDIKEPEKIEFDDDGFVTLSAEYNDACNCHPEYRDCEYVLYADDLDLEIKVFRAMIERRDEEERILEEQKKKETEAFSKQRQKEYELDQLKKLKERYE